MTAAVWTLLLAYLFGSVPAGVLVARTYGVDLRKVGSGNIGATNVLRALGWGPALVVAFFDVFKGGIAVLVARAFGLSDWMLGGVALMAVLGHNYSVFLRFRGGKGVATSFGTLLFLDPVLALWTFPIGLSVILLTRYVSAGSMTGGGGLRPLPGLGQAPLGGGHGLPHGPPHLLDPPGKPQAPPGGDGEAAWRAGGGTLDWRCAEGGGPGPAPVPLA